MATSRFNLLLLDEKETYLDDYSAYYYPPQRTEEESYRRFHRISAFLSCFLLCVSAR
jgi:hypothetical protein